jgi:hypothetical protein
MELKAPNLWLNALPSHRELVSAPSLVKPSNVATRSKTSDPADTATLCQHQSSDANIAERYSVLRQLLIKLVSAVRDT